MSFNKNTTKLKEFLDQEDPNFSVIEKELHELFDQDIMNLPTSTRSLIGEVLERVYQEFGFNEFKKLIKKIDLVSDSGKYNHRAPQKVFDILHYYLVSSLEDEREFESRFNELTTVFLQQYKESDIYTHDETGKSQFDGFEQVGGGMSATNYSYSISENHLVRHVLRPALNEYSDQNQDKAYTFVKKNCINRNEDGDIEVDKDNPDFLLRACIDVLLREYSDGENSEEALSTIKEFMSLGRGLPNKPALIFESAHKGYVELDDDQKQELVNTQLNVEGYEGMPANVFVEKIITELALEGYEKSREKLKEIVTRKGYLSRSTFDGDRIPSRIGTILSDDPELAFELCKEFLDTDTFMEELDTFHASKMGEVVQLMLAHDELQEKTLSLLRELSEKGNLTKTQQVLLTRSLCDPTNKDPDKEYLLFVFNKFLKPLLESLDNNINRDYESGEHGKIYQKLPLNLARENIVEFASKLADASCFDEALYIVKIFVDDPHPFEGYVDEPSEENKNNMHQKIKEGDDAMVISTVRGRCGWVLRKCINPKAQDKLPEVIKLTKQLLEDKNYFVQIHAILSLSILAKNRLKFMPDSDELFLAVDGDREQALEQSEDIENRAFEVLDTVLEYDTDTQKAFAKPLAKLLVQLRELNQNKAETLIEKVSKGTDQVIIECSVIFLYFAELREGDFSDWERYEDGLYDDLDSYDPEFAQDAMRKMIDRSKEIKREFSNRFVHLPKNIDDTQKGVQIGFKYFSEIIGEYDSYVFRNFYRFLENNFSEYSDKSTDLLTKTLKVERQYYKGIDADELSADQYHRYTHFGELLEVVNEHAGSEVTMKLLKKFLDFPDEVKIRLAGTLKLLREEIHTKESRELADKLEEKPGVITDQ